MAVQLDIDEIPCIETNALLRADAMAFSGLRLAADTLPAAPSADVFDMLADDRFRMLQQLARVGSWEGQSATHKLKKIQQGWLCARMSLREQQWLRALSEMMCAEQALRQTYRRLLVRERNSEIARLLVSHVYRLETAKLRLQQLQAPLRSCSQKTQSAVPVPESWKNAMTSEAAVDGPVAEVLPASSPDHPLRLASGNQTKGDSQGLSFLKEIPNKSNAETATLMGSDSTEETDSELPEAPPIQSPGLDDLGKSSALGRQDGKQ